MPSKNNATVLQPPVVVLIIETCIIHVDFHAVCEEVRRTTENQGSTTQADVPETEIVCATTSPILVVAIPVRAARCEHTNKLPTSRGETQPPTWPGTIKFAESQD